MGSLTDSQKGMVLAAVLAGLALVAAGALFLLSRDPVPPTASSGPASAAERSPADTQDASPTAASPAASPSALDPPDSTDMTLTVPALERVEGVAVRSAPGTEDGPLRQGAMHVAGTGFPWQADSNTYIAGHRLGFPGTPSDKLFWDLDDLEKGDEVILKDADNRRYEYRVFRETVVDPEEVSVAYPVPNKSVVSLQTCTLPDYGKRLVVQAELVDAPEEGNGPTPGGNEDPGGAFGVAG